MRAGIKMRNKCKWASHGGGEERPDERSGASSRRDCAVRGQGVSSPGLPAPRHAAGLHRTCLAIASRRSGCNDSCPWWSVSFFFF